MMNFILVVVLSVAFSLVGSSEKVAKQTCTGSARENEDRTLLSTLFRSKILYSPIYRFKVLNETGRPSLQPRAGKVQDFYALRDQCLRSGRLFEDPEFDAVDSSIYYNKTRSKRYSGVKWLRPHNITKNPRSHRHVHTDTSPKSPKFIEQGATRFDIRQGVQGNCWFMAAVADLASSHESLFSHVVPTDQSFDDKYCGIFHFRFWQVGYWVDVVIDDRLPTLYHELIFAKSSQSNEYWSALLEKAYAKLYGSYDALHGGREIEAMEDLTGGVGIMFDLDDQLPVPDMFEIMKSCMARQSLITAAMEKESNDDGETALKKGLPNNHAYSITDVQYVDMSVDVTAPNITERVPLIRIRNPWGDETEWNGPWSDNASEWSLLSDRDKQKLNATNADDGEYWMTYKDFVNIFDKVSVCLINPSIQSENPSDSRIRWEVSVLKGEWVRAATAGGCSVATLHQNPQYLIIVEEPDDNSTFSTIFVGLMQESQRALRNVLKVDEKYLHTGFVIYRMENSSTISKPLDAEYIQHNKWFETSKMYSLQDQREITHRFEVPPGVYCIIPCTQHSDTEGEFILRVVTEKKNYMKSLS